MPATTTTLFGFTTPTPPVVTTALPIAAPGQQPTVTASSLQVAPGDSITLTGTGFPPNQGVNAELFSDPVFLGSTVTDASGSFRMTVTIPVTTAPGGHTLRVSAVGGVPSVDLTIFVVARVAQQQPVIVAAGAGATLSRTGTDVNGPARLALALVLMGFALVGLAWRDASPLGPSGAGGRRPRARRPRRPWERARWF